MNKEKQIEKMANIIALKAFERAHLIDGEENLADIVATDLYEKGYRKASEVAREIFEEIEKSIVDLEYQAKTPRKTVKVEELKAQCDWILHEIIPKVLAELKKKYTEEGK